MKAYKVRVVEKHSDNLWVYANSKEDAECRAISYAECNFECTYSSDVIEERESDIGLDMVEE